MTEKSPIFDRADLDTLRFPPDFTWGVATSAYQIEGAASEDGRGPSIWDTFSHTPGKTLNGDTGDVACDHYHRHAEDISLISGMDLRAYRFSVAWPRVQPEGQGAWNEKGLAFYDRLCDQLRERGIAPHVTLYHWDLPAALEASGGWRNRDTCQRFADYAYKVAATLGDRAASISTHNEPWCTAFLGYHTGMFAPGYRDERMAAQVSHHLLLSHGLALQAMRGLSGHPPLGIVLNQEAVTPATRSPEDLAAAERTYANMTRWFMDPVLRGEYPDVPGVRPHPQIEEGDMRLISQPIDFLGINYYTRAWVSTEQPPRAQPFALGATNMGWEIYPQGLTEVLVRHKREYPNLPPIFITENGLASPDQLVDGEISDHQRIDYLRGHLGAIANAMRAGVDIRGYFYWSLLDNFEWNSGYTKRFGLIHVDYATQQRTPKRSAHWYREFIAASRDRAAKGV
jgi:beta-glucosidase